MRIGIAIVLSTLIIGCSPTTLIKEGKSSPVATAKIVIDGTEKDVSIEVQQDFKQVPSSAPAGWVKESIPKMANRMAWTKDGYSIVITQEAGHTAICQSGAKAADVDAPFVITLGNFVEFTGKDGSKYVRGKGSSDSKATVYTICEKGDQGFMSPTLLGFISYYTPLQADESMLQQMDQIISTL